MKTGNLSQDYSNVNRYTNETEAFANPVISRTDFVEILVGQFVKIKLKF